MLNNEYPPLGGGQGNANKYLFEQMVNEYPEINIDIITSSVNNYRKEDITSNSIYYLNIGKKNKNYHHQNVKDLILYTLKSFFFARKLIKKNKYDLTIAWASVPAGFISFLLKKIFNIPYIVLLRGPDVPFHEKKWYYLDKFVLQFLSPYVWKNAKHVVANSLVLKELAQNISKKTEIKVITNGIDGEYFFPEPKHKLQNEIKLLSVGRISKIKGFDLVIHAISKLKNIDLTYTIVGDGPESKNLETLKVRLGLEKKVFLSGIKSKNELREIYRSSDIFILPSHNEGMSNALLEAMACGLPVIVTNAGGTIELINHGKNGFIFPKGNIDELVKCLSILINDENKRLELGINARKTAEIFSWKMIASEFKKLIL